MALINGNQANGNVWRHNAGPDAHAGTINDSDRAALELLRYWNLLWRRRWLIGAITLVIARAFDQWYNC